MLTTKGYFHSQETFGTVDGPGMRYVLFLSGCQLQCSFCHNPDTWIRGNKTITVDEVIADYEQYRTFYEASGGGITVSGGEPLLQADFVRELFRACRERNIHTTLDTSGYVPLENVNKVLPYTDLVLFCVKAMDNGKHRSITAGFNNQVIDNLTYIANQVKVIVRYVIIPNVNDAQQDIDALGSFVNNLAADVAIELLPYHCLGKSKWQRLGKEYKLENVLPATNVELDQAKKWLSRQNVACFY